MSASLFERYNWLSAPVVDENHRLVGRITIDDVVDIIREDAEHSMMSMAGLDDDEDTFAPVMQSTKRRSVWLAVNLVTALMAAMVSDLFEAVAKSISGISYFEHYCAKHGRRSRKPDPNPCYSRYGVRSR